MTSSRLVRGAKTRMFAFICLVFVLGALVYIFHGTQTRLFEVQQQAGICSQKFESLSAQMQVVREYKLRLAATLNKEKEEHRQTKDLLEKKLKEEKDKWEKENLETKNKYDALVQKNNILQGQLEDIKEKFNELELEKKKQEDDLKKETEAKRDALEKLKTDFFKNEEEIKDLRKRLTEQEEKCLPEGQQKNFFEKRSEQLEREFEETKKELEFCKSQNRPPLPLPLAAISSSPKTEDKNIEPDTNVGEIPRLLNGGFSRNITSTPGINPMAVGGDMSSVKPIAEADPAQRKIDDQVKIPSKKPTQESIVPLAQPGNGKYEQGMAQIPGPPDHRTNTLQKPKTNDQANEQMSNVIVDEPEDSLLNDQQVKGQLREPFIPVNNDRNGIGVVGGAAGMDVEGIGQPQPIGDREEEEDGGGEVNMGNLNNNQVHKNPENYHGGDYDKEQPEEEDDEGEQIDYDADRVMKEGGKVKLLKNQKPVGGHNEGVMLNPK